MLMVHMSMQGMSNGQSSVVLLMEVTEFQGPVYYISFKRSFCVYCTICVHRYNGTLDAFKISNKMSCTSHYFFPNLSILVATIFIQCLTIALLASATAILAVFCIIKWISRRRYELLMRKSLSLEEVGQCVYLVSRIIEQYALIPLIIPNFALPQRTCMNVTH